MQNRANKSLTVRSDGTSSEISDLYGAAYLAVVGQRVLAVELDGDGRNRFIFAAGDGLTAAYLDFLNNAQIGVQNFISGIYALKRLMREAENEWRRR